MKTADKGKYIQYVEGYIKPFIECLYDIEILDIYTQLCFYNKIFFSVIPK